jgi:hypothetical protein
MTPFRLVPLPIARAVVASWMSIRSRLISTCCGPLEFSKLHQVVISRSKKAQFDGNVTHWMNLTAKPFCEAFPSAAKPFSMDWFKGQIIGNTHDIHRNLSMVSCNFPMGVSYEIYHLVICCIARENPPIF